MAVGETGPGGHLLTAWNLADLNSVTTAVANLGGPFLIVANNLSDVASASTALANLGGMPLGDTTWTTVTSFTNSWAAVAGQTPRYAKIGNHLVSIQGQVTGGSLTAAAFQLPAGYRPTSFNLTFATSSNAAAGSVTIGSGGSVTPQTGSTTNVFLNITFSVL